MLRLWNECIKNTERSSSDNADTIHNIYYIKLLLKVCWNQPGKSDKNYMWLYFLERELAQFKCSFQSQKEKKSFNHTNKQHFCWLLTFTIVAVSSLPSGRSSMISTLFKLNGNWKHQKQLWYDHLFKRHWRSPFLEVCMNVKMKRFLDSP